MSDFIDIHSHALFGFDDGAENKAETLEILRRAAEAGFVAVAMTPHVMIGVYEHEREELEKTLADIESELAAQALPLRVVAGAEYYLDDNFFGLLESGNLRLLGFGDHLLVELPLLRIPPMFREVAFRIRIKGMVPVLAHPERYAEIGRKPKQAALMREAGYLIQLNLGSLIGMYGRSARRAAEWMLKKDLVDFVGSDAHTPAQAAQVFGEGVEALRRLVGDQELRRLLIDNPRAALFGPDKSEEGK